MRIILQEPVEHLGNIGDIVTVADGYARNYLLPTGRAIIANEGNLKYVEHHLRGLEKKRMRLQAQGEALKQKIETLTLEFERKVGDQGKLFGSVTAMDIAEQLAEKGIEIDRRKIELPEAIKTIGDFTVNVKVQVGIVAELKVVVVGDRDDIVLEAETAVEDAAAAPAAEDEAVAGDESSAAGEEVPAED
jgi:large subunit ribosomal protein L9